MRVVSATEIDAALTFPALIDALAEAFRGDWAVPVRHHHSIRSGPEDEATLLLMPAWTGEAPGGGYVGTKIVTVFPANSARALPAVSGIYVLLDGRTGAPAAVMDGTRLTLWRTAAASALAARHLARPDAATLAMIGAGALAPFLIRAHASVRPIRSVRIWNRSRAGAERLAAEIRAAGLAADPADTVEAAVRGADIVSCATLSGTPLVQGAWLEPGSHLDLVGAFRPTMRESDDDAVRRADIYVDTREGALKEAGDLAIPIANGILAREDIAGELAELCTGRVPGRRTARAITLFKSVGTAVEDLAAAILVCRKITGEA